MNWRGRPATYNRTIVELITSTTTESGLTVNAVDDPDWSPRGVKISHTQHAVPTTPTPRLPGAWRPAGPPHMRVTRVSSAVLICSGLSGGLHDP